MPQRYLSTDPNAGDPLRGAYLATDPDAGDAVATPTIGPAPTPRSWTDLAVDLLPTAGGALGGIVGGIGGTAFGLGVGGVPGAIGGATLGGGAGEAFKQLINRARGEEAPASPLEAATDIGQEGALQGAMEAVGGAVTKGVSKGAQAVYRGYLKPSLAEKNLGKAGEVVETALREGLAITRGGAAKAQRLLGELRGEVDRILQASPAHIDLKQVADKVRAFARAKYYKPGGDVSDFDAVMSVADRIDNHPSLGIPPGAQPTRIDVPVASANQSKRVLQETAAPSYGTPNAVASKQATKVGARELRLGIEAASGGPGGAVAKLNAREAKLIDAARAIRLAVEREANQSKLYGVKTLASVGVGGVDYARNQDPLAAVAKGAATRALLNPGVASLSAIVANRIAKGLGVGASTAARLAAYVLSESDGEAEQVPQ